RKFTLEGKLVKTFGTQGVPSDTGSDNFSKIKRAAGPFNGPTDVAFNGADDLYISDGYGNARVHRFTDEGDLISSWGTPGDRPGQFNLPHNSYTDGRVLYVLDRENHRVQLFTLKGEFLSEWTDFAGPTGISPARDGSLFISEFGYDPVRPARYRPPKHGVRILPRVTVRSPEGKLLAKIEGKDMFAPGSFFAPHSLCVDPLGDVYVAEVPITRRATRECHTLQKLVKQ
ncbi:MAG: peptidyl-alpha-hydroxyglycine alpha-amidating lyase family protein, partial [Nitrososphaerales archaeon]